MFAVAVHLLLNIRLSANALYIGKAMLAIVELLGIVTTVVLCLSKSISAGCVAIAITTILNYITVFIMASSSKEFVYIRPANNTANATLQIAVSANTMNASSASNSSSSSSNSSSAMLSV